MICGGVRIIKNKSGFDNTYGVYKTMKYLITPRVVSAYPQCKLKAYLLLKGGKGTKCEFVEILEEKAIKNKENFISMIKIKTKEVYLDSSRRFKGGTYHAQSHSYS